MPASKEPAPATPAIDEQPEVPSTPAQVLGRFRTTWRSQTRAQAFWVRFWFVLLVSLLVAQLSRLGWDWARILGAALLVSALFAMVVWWWLDRRAWKDPRSTIRRVLSPTNPVLAERALRAERLALREHAGESSTLAEAHYQRQLGAASVEAILASARRRGRRWRLLWVMLALGVLVVLGAGPLRIIEGFNVLAASNGEAPVRLAYLKDAALTVEVPAYLRAGTMPHYIGESATVPQGSVVTVRGTPQVEGRKFVLTDGLSDLPLVSDGRGGLVGRWTVTDPTDLRVAAVFGDVKIFDAVRTVLSPRADRPPLVVLEGAPRTMELREMPRLELRFITSDDHGLEQVDLVLRSGRREERRELAALDGRESLYRGGAALLPTDPFLRDMFLPAEISIEARDNDPVDGPKWGRSAAITIVPPPVGRQDAELYARLRSIREALVTLVAVEFADDEERRQVGMKEVEKALGSALDARGGLEVPSGARKFLEAQLEALRRPGSERASAEAVLVAVDVLLRRASDNLAREVSTRLGDVVEELAVRSHEAARSHEERVSLEPVTQVLEFAQAGARELSKVGVLGRDLGSVAQGDLGRVKRALETRDFAHAELAAQHLAARLRRPNPSFGSKGKGGVESGMPSGGAQGEAPPSTAPGDFDQLAEQIDELARDHAEGVSEMDRLIEEAMRAAQSDEMRDDAERRAERLRNAVRNLPEVGYAERSARSSAAQGRGYAEAMADGLEQQGLQQAIESGERALDALEEAERLLEESGGGYAIEQTLQDAERVVSEELADAKRRQDEMRKRANQAAQPGLDEAAERERSLAERAQQLAQRGREGDTPLPGEVLEALERASRQMRDASQKLRAGDAERGAELQREAQRSLEQSRMGRARDAGKQSDSSEESASDGVDGKDFRRDAQVPGAREEDRTEAFRERVQRGLSKPSGKWGAAVRRYAESLQ